MTKKYNVIYADPPWFYKNWSNQWHKDHKESRWVWHQYPLMELEDIKKLPVTELADKDCLLFLWATFPTLPEAIETLKAWGFKYKTVAFTWVKTNKKSESLFWGMGFWTRSNAEICLLGTRGNPKRISASVHQVVMSPVEQHSKKPDVVRERIVQLVGDIPRIELFARQKAEGWDALGFDADGNEISETLNNWGEQEYVVTSEYPRKYEIK